MTDKTNNVEFAFVVIKQKDGRIAIGNLEGQEADRDPTIDDIFGALSIVTRDIQVQQSIAGMAQIIAQASGAPQPGSNNSKLIVPEPTSKFKKVTRV